MSFKVLVFCHHRKIVRPSDHFAYNFMMSYVPPGATVTFQTVDKTGDPDYKIDAFSMTFARDHLLEYDLLFMLDCGGEWFYTQQYDTKDSGQMYLNRLNFRDRVLHVTSNMVKPGGSIVMSKLISPKFLQEMIRGFQRKNWTTILDKNNDFFGDAVLTLQKPVLRMLVDGPG